MRECMCIIMIIGTVQGSIIIGMWIILRTGKSELTITKALALFIMLCIPHVHYV